MDLIYQKSVESVFDHFASGRDGLSSEQVKKLTITYGANKLPTSQSLSLWKLWWRQFASPLVVILFLAAGVSFFIGETHEAWFIVLVLIINALVGFVQEYKAEQTLASLKKTLALRARVVRGGKELFISSEELVPGDIVVVKAGDKIPADGRVIEAHGLEINESSLTGESLSVIKQTSALVFTLPLGDQTSMVFMSTLVDKGIGRFCVTATGLNTEIGKLAALVEGTPEPLTPLARKISVFSRWISGFIIAIVAGLLAFGLWSGQSFLEIFSTSLALAVSAIPEGLPVVITVMLVFGMRRLLAKQALVKKLNVAETLGGVTVICTDKTGTLTKGDMAVSHILTTSQELLFHKDSRHKFDHNNLESHVTALKIAMLAMDAVVENPDTELGDWVVSGSPTERAMALAGLSAGLAPKVLEENYRLIENLPFDSRHKFSATRRSTDRGQVIMIAGAAEAIIKRVHFLDQNGQVEALKSAALDDLLAKSIDLSKKGLRLIACAYRPIAEKEMAKKTVDLVESGLVFAGFIALKDPVRPEVAEALAATMRAGVRTIVITGDHRHTAVAIAGELGLKINEDNVVDGVDIDAMSDDELTARLPKVLLCARVSPENKIRIIKSLRASGEVVAMIGDGVNDAPALAAADIGVAVGSGTEIAKEASDMVLLDGNFKTLVTAIEEGRIIFENIRKVIIYLLADNFSEIVVIFVAILLKWPLPLVAAQILFINLIVDTLPAIALSSSDEPRALLMSEKPRKLSAALFGCGYLLWIAVIFVVSAISLVGAYVWHHLLFDDVALTQTFIFALTTVDSLLLVGVVSSLRRPLWRKDLLTNSYLLLSVFVGLVLLLAAVYWSVLQNVLHTVQLAPWHWVAILIISAIEIFVLEITKSKFINSRS